MQRLIRVMAIMVMLSTVHSINIKNKEDLNNKAISEKKSTGDSMLMQAHEPAHTKGVKGASLILGQMTSSSDRLTAYGTNFEMDTGMWILIIIVVVIVVLAIICCCCFCVCAKTMSDIDNGIKQAEKDKMDKDAMEKEKMMGADGMAAEMDPIMEAVMME